MTPSSLACAGPPGTNTVNAWRARRSPSAGSNPTRSSTGTGRAGASSSSALASPVELLSFDSSTRPPFAKAGDRPLSRRDTGFDGAAVTGAAFGRGLTTGFAPGPANVPSRFRDLRLSRHSTGLFAGMFLTGATGLEPATSGVTGHFSGDSLDDDRSAIRLITSILEPERTCLAWLRKPVPNVCCPSAARNRPTLVVWADDRLSAVVAVTAGGRSGRQVRRARWW